MNHIITSIIIGAVAGAAAGTIATVLASTGDQNRIAEYYETETAVSVSPHEVRVDIERGEDDFVLVDLRGEAEYLQGHIVGAVNIPGYSPADADADAAEQRIVTAFAALPDDADIITYCYSAACMLSRNTGAMLAPHGIYPKHLNIGWIEWKDHWNLWNTASDLETRDPADYVSVGTEPGEFSGNESEGSCSPGADDALSC